MGSEILRCAQDDSAVLSAALWPTRAHVQLRLMGIWADLSAPTKNAYTYSSIEFIAPGNTVPVAAWWPTQHEQPGLKAAR